MECFAYQTVQLIKRSLYLLEEGTGIIKGVGIDQSPPPRHETIGEEEGNGEFKGVDVPFFHHFCSTFGELSFLEPG